MPDHDTANHGTAGHSTAGSDTTGTILVTGATGNIGHHVVAGLIDAGADVRVLARDPSSARLPAGVDVVKGDLTGPDSLGEAFHGVSTVFLLWPLFSTATAPAVVDLMAAHARKVVYVSAMAETPGTRPDGFWGEIEALIERSGMEWTFLRSGGMAANVLGWADQIRATGTVSWPYGDAGRSLIHESDIAAIAVEALLGDGHAGAAYDLTGPEVVTQADQIRIIGEVIGRELRWEELPPERAREELIAAWADEAFVEQALSTWASLVENPEPVTSTVQDVTGKRARTFREWAVDHADEFPPTGVATP